MGLGAPVVPSRDSLTRAALRLALVVLVRGHCTRYLRPRTFAHSRHPRGAHGGYRL